MKIKFIDLIFHGSQIYWQQEPQHFNVHHLGLMVLVFFFFVNNGFKNRN